MKPEEAENPAAENSTDDTDYEVYPQPEAVATHEFSGDEAGK